MNTLFRWLDERFLLLSYEGHKALMLALRPDRSREGSRFDPRRIASCVYFVHIGYQNETDAIGWLYRRFSNRKLRRPLHLTVYEMATGRFAGSVFLFSDEDMKVAVEFKLRFG